MALTDKAIKNAKPAAKKFRLADGFGLYLLVRPTGSKAWCYDYSIASRRKTVVLGVYPDMGLALARQRLIETKKLVSENVDPATLKKFAKGAPEGTEGDSLGQVADEYIARLLERENPPAQVTIDKKKWILERLLTPELRSRPVDKVSPAEMLVFLQSLEKSGRKETARRARSLLSAVFRYAITTLRAEHDPTAVLKDAIQPPQVTHHAAIIDETEFGQLITSIREYDGWPTLRLALLFVALTMSRPGEARRAVWDEFDLEGKVWTIPAKRMKMRRPHEVPLSTQALDILSEAKAIDPYSPYVFPMIRTNRKPLSENAMNSALRRMGYTKTEMTSHGFRSSASSILNGRGYDPEIIELCLAHTGSDKIRAIYNRARRWPERTQLMQRWANIVDTLTLI